MWGKTAEWSCVIFRHNKPQTAIILVPRLVCPRQISNVQWAISTPQTVFALFSQKQTHRTACNQSLLPAGGSWSYRLHSRKRSNHFYSSKFIGKGPDKKLQAAWRCSVATATVSTLRFEAPGRMAQEFYHVAQKQLLCALWPFSNKPSKESSSNL